MFAHRRHIADLKEAHERHVSALEKTVLVLADQVEWLRAMVGRPQPVRAQSVEQPEFVLDHSLHMSEEEEDIEALLRSGEISPDAAEAALQALGFANTHIEVSPE